MINKLFTLNERSDYIIQINIITGEGKAND